MAQRVVVGSGPVGTTLARLLAERGDDVTVVTRSGTGPDHPTISLVKADAGDAGRLADIASGAATIFNCVNPPYTDWVTAWPPLATSFLTAAEKSGAALVIMGNLYPYGPVDGPMTEDLPLAAPGTKAKVRAAMWNDALTAERAGRVRVTEVRASDFFGPEVVVNSHVGERFVPKLLAGKRAQVVGNPTMPHSWTYMPDIAATLARVADDPDAFGRPWHVPTVPATSAVELGQLITDAAGVRPARVMGLPHAVMLAAGVFSPMLKELRETEYQFTAPYVLDSSETEKALGLSPTPLAEQIATTVAWWQRRGSAG